MGGGKFPAVFCRGRAKTEWTATNCARQAAANATEKDQPNWEMRTMVPSPVKRERANFRQARKTEQKIPRSEKRDKPAQ
jgi:hypothetical protein